MRWFLRTGRNQRAGFGKFANSQICEVAGKVLRRRAAPSLIGAAATSSLSLVAGCLLFTDLSGFSTGAADASAVSEHNPDGDGSLNGDGSIPAISDAMSSDYRTEVLTDEPAAYLRLGETAPTTLAAKSEVGTLTCAFVGAPKLGVQGAIASDPDTAYELDGTAGLDCGKVFDFVGAQPYSLEVWARFDAIDADHRHLFTKDVDVPALAAREEYGVVVQEDARLVFERYVAGGATNAKATAVGVGSTFRHLVAVYTGTNLHLFVDGRLAGAVPDDRPAAPKDTSFFVGMKNPAGGFFIGAIDELAVYTKVLPPERIIAHYAAGSGER